MVPERKGDFATVVLRSLLTGMCVSMLNACLAGRSLPTGSRAREIQGGTGTGLKIPINGSIQGWRWLAGLPCSPLMALSKAAQAQQLSWSPSSSSGLEHFMGNFWSMARSSLKSWGVRWDLHSPRYRICNQV